jgi:hypothetical protein
MKKQLPAILLGIASIALLVAYIGKNSEVHRLQKELAQLKNEPGIETAAPDTAKPSGGMAAEGTDKGSAEQVTSLASSEPPAETTEASGRRMMENMAKMMENPTMNKVMEASQRGAITALYDDLIDYLNLNEEEKKYFMDLLMHRQMKQMDMAMKMMSGSLSDEEKQTLQQEIEDATNTVKEEMEKFLNNPEDFAEFEFYEKTIGERMMLSQMDQDLSGSGDALSDKTYRELLGMMHDEKENYDFTSDLNDNENMDMSAERFSQDNIRNYAQDIQQLNDNISAKARSILTPDQYEAFAKSLKTTTDMQLSQLEMAAQMFGGGKTTDGTE